jgi:hypothetical protein
MNSFVVDTLGCLDLTGRPLFDRDIKTTSRLNPFFQSMNTQFKKKKWTQHHLKMTFTSPKITKSKWLIWLNQTRSTSSSKSQRQQVTWRSKTLWLRKVVCILSGRRCKFLSFQLEEGAEFRNVTPPLTEPLRLFWFIVSIKHVYTTLKRIWLFEFLCGIEFNPFILKSISMMTSTDSIYLKSTS